MWIVICVMHILRIQTMILNLQMQEDIWNLMQYPV